MGGFYTVATNRQPRRSQTMRHRRSLDTAKSTVWDHGDSPQPPCTEMIEFGATNPKPFTGLCSSITGERPRSTNNWYSMCVQKPSVYHQMVLRQCLMFFIFAWKTFHVRVPTKMFTDSHNTCYVPKEARFMDPFAKPTPLIWWQTTPCNTKEHRSQILETLRILPFAKHITPWCANGFSHLRTNFIRHKGSMGAYQCRGDGK